MDIPKTYNPQDHEDKIYEKWEKSGFFNPDNLDLPEDAIHYCISMPPPNVTGVLHLGHALENAIMDIETRYHRMKGKRTLLVPGTDHAAVATQAKVEKLLTNEGIENPREQLGREKLLARIREYAENSKSTIINQIKKMGTSCDWSRLAYTFDRERSRAVNEVFIKMYNDGLIYKGYRVVNWSVKGQSTCSDDEVEYYEEKATLYTFRYGQDFPIVISTTRPETKLGDTAVAVHPKDDRYQKYIGKTYRVDVGSAKPLEIKVIADDEVDPQFGTGALGVTPAHSQIDFELKEKHGLKLIPVIGIDGKMTKEAGNEYFGLTVKQAREKFVAWLEDEKLLENKEEVTHNIGKSDRFGDIVEAIPMEQWFVGVNKKIPGKEKTLKDLMRDAVTTGHSGDKNKKINITPERFKDQYLHWIDNLRDWCISRQIWWGHRIPVWYPEKESSLIRDRKKQERVYVGIDPPKEEGWIQDPDTLDTWFSSGTWTFSTLGWPENSPDLKKYHPTSWMQMGYEILFFWMARMILMSTYALDQIPFKEAYFHGMLRDKHGQKFSKSLGNGIDPIDMANQYGTDALRISLVLGTTPGNDSRFYEEKIQSAKLFINKLWNISRYVLANEKRDGELGNLDAKDCTLADLWIMDKMGKLIADVDDHFEAYRFSQAGEQIRNFLWEDFADWYVETSKFEINKKTKSIILNRILQDTLKLLHPFVPFVTEAIWQNIGKNMLIVESWPAVNPYLEIIDQASSIDTAHFEDIKSIIVAIRNARSEYQISPSKKIDVIIYAGKDLRTLNDQQQIIKNLRTGIGNLELKETGKKIPKSFYVSLGNIEMFIPLQGIVDINKERKRLKAEIEKLQKYQLSLQAKLKNKKFVENAPSEVVENTNQKISYNKERLEKIKVFLANIE